MVVFLKVNCIVLPFINWSGLSIIKSILVGEYIK